MLPLGLGRSHPTLSPGRRAGGTLLSKVLQVTISDHLRPSPHRGFLSPKPPEPTRRFVDSGRSRQRPGTHAPLALPPDFPSGAGLHPLGPLGIQRASGKLRELPKHLVTLIVLLINGHWSQRHGKCCLGTGAGTCSGESSGWTAVTGERDGDLWGQGRQAAGWPKLGPLGAFEGLWGT